MSSTARFSLQAADQRVHFGLTFDVPSSQLTGWLRLADRMLTVTLSRVLIEFSRFRRRSSGAGARTTLDQVRLLAIVSLCLPVAARSPMPQYRHGRQ